MEPYGKHLEASSDSLDMCIRVLRDVALALQYANELGIYHRDVSYLNIVADTRTTPPRGILID